MVSQEPVGIVPGRPIGGRGDQQLDLAFQNLYSPLGIFSCGSLFKPDKGGEQHKVLDRVLHNSIGAKNAEQDGNNFGLQRHDIRLKKNE